MFLYLLLKRSNSLFKEFIFKVFIIKAVSEAFFFFFLTYLFTNLPPIWIFTVYDLKNFSFRKFQTCFFAWDEVVIIRIIIKMTLHKNLKCKKIYNTYMLQNTFLLIYLSKLKSVFIYNIKILTWSDFPFTSKMQAIGKKTSKVQQLRKQK